MNPHNLLTKLMSSNDSLQAEKFQRSVPVFHSILEASANRSEYNLKSVLLQDYSSIK